MTRTPKTPRQRAQEALDVAERHVTRFVTKAANLRTELALVEHERDAAIARRDHLKRHPDLTTTSTPTGDDA